MLIFSVFLEQLSEVILDWGREKLKSWSCDRLKIGLIVHRSQKGNAEKHILYEYHSDEKDLNLSIMLVNDLVHVVWFILSQIK